MFLLLSKDAFDDPALKNGLLAMGNNKLKDVLDAKFVKLLSEAKNQRVKSILDKCFLSGSETSTNITDFKAVGQI